MKIFNVVIIGFYPDNTMDVNAVIVRAAGPKTVKATQDKVAREVMELKSYARVQISVFTVNKEDLNPEPARVQRDLTGGRTFDQWLTSKRAEVEAANRNA